MTRRRENSRLPLVCHLAAGCLALCLLLPPAAAQSVVPQPDCCARIYDTGRWLGWAAALLDGTREREAPAPADSAIVRCLRSAGENAAGAYRACSSGVPAWPDWKQRQLWLQGHIAELGRVSDPVKSHQTRRQLIASAVLTMYGQWADDLSWEKVDGQMLKRRTCAACYFQLGYDLACATQSYRQALAANAARDLQAALAELNRARLRLQKALAVLDAYEAVPQHTSYIARFRCAAIGAPQLARLLRAIAAKAPSLVRAGEELEVVGSASDDLGRMLAANCAGDAETRQARPPEEPPRRDEGELAGDWAVQMLMWNNYISPEWPNRWAAKAGEFTPQTLWLRFETRGGGNYSGIILRQPTTPWWLHPFDAFGKRTHLYRPGLELMTLRKVGPNLYRGTHKLLGIPGNEADPDRAWGFYRKECVVVVFGEAAKVLSGINPDQTELFDRNHGAGMLLLRQR